MGISKKLHKMKKTWKGSFEMIIVHLNILLAKNNMSVTELSERLGISIQNVSILKNGHLKAIRISTLNKLCEIFNCQPNDLFEYIEDTKNEII